MRGECVNNHASDDSNGGTGRNAKVLHIACGIRKNEFLPVPKVVVCQECQDRCSTAEVQTALLQRGGIAAVPLLVEHSHISDLGGQRLVSVIQYTIVELF